MKWTTEYQNDVGYDDGGFWEWWEVTNWERRFKADPLVEAEWLCGVLNNLEDSKG